MNSSSILQEESDLPKNHTAARRIDFSNYDSSTLYNIIEDHCVHKNEPLVISNLHKTNGWDDNLFQLDQLKKFRGDSVIPNKMAKKNEEHKLGDYITTIQKKYNLGVNDQDNHPSQAEVVKGKNTKNRTWKRDLDKLYGKDIICPTEYDVAMKKFLPDYLIPKGNCDLFSFLPTRFQAENLMCYLGQDETGTPIHRDLCGTMGHNIMTMATPGGYAEWIIILNRDRDTLSSYIKPSAKENKMINRKDRDTNSISKSSFMESDRAWLTQETIINSTLNVQVIIQRPGDLVIIPSRAYHQVRNVGVSIKIAWNRITPQSLHSAFEDQLPMYQIINRPEIYKCKAIVNYSIQKWNEYLSSAKDWEDFCKLEVMRYAKQSFINDVRILADLYYNKVLLPEVLEPNDEEGVFVDEDPAEFCTVICDFCHSDVFYRYYHCKICDDYDLCMGCYSIGRSCQHVDQMYMCRSPVEFSSLIELYTSFVANVNRVYKSPEKDALIDQSHILYNPSAPSIPTLATICRRIERFRKDKGLRCNQLTCTHCAHTTKIAFEKKERISVFYAFQRYPCPNARPKFKARQVDLYVCDTCSSKCDSCQTVLVPKLTIEYDLVYFTHPALDNRNWGAFFDSNINRSCFYPKVFYETFTESKKKKSKPATKKYKIKNKQQREDDADFVFDQIMEDPRDDDRISTRSKKRKVNSRRSVRLVENTSEHSVASYQATSNDLSDNTEISGESEEESMNEIWQDTDETSTNYATGDIENETYEHLNLDEVPLKTEKIFSGGYDDIPKPLKKSELNNNEQTTKIRWIKSKYTVEAPTSSKSNEGNVDVIFHNYGSSNNTNSKDDFPYLNESGITSSDNEPAHTIII